MKSRRRYAHRATRGRQPLFAVAAGVILVALCIPLAWRALSGDDHSTAGQDATPSRQAASRRTTSSPSPSTGAATSSVEAAPTTAPSAAPSTTSSARVSPGVLIRVVPAVRDVQVLVDQTLYTTTSDGTIDVPTARGTVPVSFVGYSVIPALQEVVFRSWSDGVATPARTLDAGGHGHMSLAIDVSYRVTVSIVGGKASGPAVVTAASPAGPVRFTSGTRRWVLALRGEQSGHDVVARPIPYSFDPPRGAPAGSRQQFTASPEALWVVRAP